MLNPDFDPYNIMLDLSNNQVRITDFQRELAHRLNEQQAIIDELTAAVASQNQTNELLARQLLELFKELHNG